MKIGYARVSKLEQSLDSQIEDLKKSGCEKIITDKLSGSVSDRPGLSQIMEFIRKGDTLVVWRLDRLGRSTRHLIKFLNELEEVGANFLSLTESIDTQTPSGKLTFHLFCSLAEFERNLIIERTRRGLAEARARGRVGGRKKKLDDNQFKMMKKIYDEKETPVRDICKTFGISAPTFYKYLRASNHIP